MNSNSQNERVRMNAKCKLCDGSAEPFFEMKAKKYYQCGQCSAIFLDPECYVSKEDEKKRYLEHNNDVDDPGYRKRPSWTRSARHLPMETFKQFYETFRKYLMFLLYWEWGEPFEHPELEDMIAISSKDAIPSVTFTNGIIKLPEERLKKLIESRLSLIQICVDATNQKDFAKTRPAGTLAEVLHNIEALSKIKAKMNSEYPVIMFRTHATRHNEKDLPKMRSIAKNVGADIFSLKAVRPFDYDGYNFDETLVPLDEALCRYKYKTKEKKPESRIEKVKVNKFTCGKPLFLPTLDSDGYIRMCSYGGDEHRMSKIEDKNPVEKAWYGKNAREIREKFVSNKGSNLCKSCYFRSYEMPSPILETTVFNDLPKDISVVE